MGNATSQQTKQDQHVDHNNTNNSIPSQTTVDDKHQKSPSTFSTPSPSLPTTQHQKISTPATNIILPTRRKSGLFSASDLNDNVCGSPLNVSESVQTNTDAVTPLLSSSFLPPSLEKSLGRSDAAGADESKKQKSLGIIIEDEGVPTLMSWNARANQVYIVGTFNEWKEKIPMVKGKNDFTCVLKLKPGNHRLKFLVDGEWKCSPDLETALDGNGNLVNYIEVKAEDLTMDVSTLLESTAKLPTSPRTPIMPDSLEYSQDIPSYLTQMPPADSYMNASYSSADPYLSSMNSLGFNNYYSSFAPAGARLSVSSNYSLPPNPLSEPPPNLPPHLEKIALNSSSSASANTKTAFEDPILLATPNHVCINHLYALSIRDGVMGLASTRRFRNKYITTVFYRPVNRQ